MAQVIAVTSDGFMSVDKLRECCLEPFNAGKNLQPYMSEKLA